MATKNNKAKQNKVLGAVALALVGILVGGAIGGTAGYFIGKDKAEEKPSEIITPAPDPVTGADQGTVVTPDRNGDTASSGIRLMSARIASVDYEDYGIAPQSDSACTITAQITPADADDQTVDFAIAWKDPESEWATGKSVTDYFTLTQSADGSLTAVLTCKQAFAEQAIVTVTSRPQPNITATATVDYFKKLLKTTYGASNGLYLDGNTTNVKTWNQVTSHSFTDEWSIGTIDDTVVSHSISVTTSSALRTQLSSVFTSTSAKNKYEATRTYLTSGETFSWDALFRPAGKASGFYEIEGLFSFCSDLNDYADWNINSTQYNKLKNCLKAANEDFVMVVTTETEKGGTYSQTYNVNVSDAKLKTLVTSIGGLSPIEF